MTKIQKIILIVVSCTVFITAVIATFEYRREQMNYESVNLYFYNSAAKTLESEKRSVKILDEKTIMIQDLLTMLKNGPKKAHLISSIPKEVSIVNSKITEPDGNFIITLSSDYDYLSPSDKLILKSALVWTLTEFDFIKNVTVLSETDEKEGLTLVGYNRYNLVINPKITPGGKKVPEELALYFPNKNTGKLSEVKKNIEFDVLSEKGKIAVEELLKGPGENSGLSKVLPENIKLLDYRKLNNTCYVDFSSEFLTSISTDPIMERLQIYSIVNTLTSLSSHKTVQFLVDGTNIIESGYSGKLDLSMPLERDNTLIE